MGRLRNKRVKQMIADSALKGRKIYPVDEGVIIIPNVDKESPLVSGVLYEYFFYWHEAVPKSLGWRWLWKDCVCEMDGGKMKGKPVRTVCGGMFEGFELLPVVCAVWGDWDDVVELTGDY